MDRQLSDLRERHRYRALRPRMGMDFASNDYLGLAGSDRLRRAVAAALERGVAVGSGGSRLLRGNDPEHEALERQAAAFFGAEAALYLGTGYAANAMLLATLPQAGDVVVFDALIHASAHEGMRLGRAERMAAAHNDVDAVEDAIRGWRAAGGTGTPWIAVESLYSMDGDCAALGSLAEVADRYDAMLLIDEAHATGVYGPDGRGLAAALEGRANVVTLRTCGKAMGCEGALVLCSATVRDFLINLGRAFIFSTAPSPLMAAAVREALCTLRDEPERRERLGVLARTAERLLGPLGATCTGTQIVPLVLGDEERTMLVAAAVRAAGFDVRGIRPPSVPEGGSRLRISLTLNVGTAEVEGLANALEEALR